MVQETSSPRSTTDAQLAKRRSRVLNYLVGEVMKLEPRANPQLIKDILLKKLST